MKNYLKTTKKQISILSLRCDNRRFVDIIKMIQTFVSQNESRSRRLKKY